MPDLDALLNRQRQGQAAEGARGYFGERLRKYLAAAEHEIVNAYQAGDEIKLTRAVAKWIEARELLRAFDRDILIGDAATRELRQTSG